MASKKKANPKRNPMNAVDRGRQIAQRRAAYEKTMDEAFGKNWKKTGGKKKKK